MATREKKARLVNSPTPSLTGSNNGGSAAAGGADSPAPLTPTSGGGGAARKGGGSSTVTTPVASNSTRTSLSRSKSKQMLLAANEETNSEEPLGVGGDSQVTATSSESSGGTKTNSAASGGGGGTANAGSATRVTRAAKEELAVSGSDTASTKDDGTAGAAQETASPTKEASAAGGGGGKANSQHQQQQPTTNQQLRAAAAKSMLRRVVTQGSARRAAVTALKKTALLKRKAKPIIGKPVLGKKVVAKKQPVSTSKGGKKEITVALKEDQTATGTGASLRNGKPRTSDSPSSKRKAPAFKDTTTSGPPVKLERRRSESVLAMSDRSPPEGSVTRSASVMAKDDEDKRDEGMAMDVTPTVAELKKELMEESDARIKILDKMAEAFNERKPATRMSPVPKAQSASATSTTPSDEKTVRRSMRQRKSTNKDKDDFVTPKQKVSTEIKVEIPERPPAQQVTSPSPPPAAPATTTTATDEEPEPPPLTIDTEVPKEPTGTGAEAEKDSSLSPELISEGVSELSVKEFYSEPAFLENNLGIEKDPKLGEIVQVQEKFKFGGDKGDGASTDCDEALETSSNLDDVGAEESSPLAVLPLTNEEVKMEIDRVREIIGVEPLREDDKSLEPAAIALAQDETNSGNESPLSSDRESVSSVIAAVVTAEGGGSAGVCTTPKSNGKGGSDVTTGKKVIVDSKSDSDGERSTRTPTTPRSKASGSASGAGGGPKEAKQKTRYSKEKVKEDEKVKEEKLRQEKLRVEEKVREEKLRAERLQIEEEMRLKEGSDLKVCESGSVAEIRSPLGPGAVSTNIGEPVTTAMTPTSSSTSPSTSATLPDQILSAHTAPVTITTSSTAGPAALTLTSADTHFVVSVTAPDAVTASATPVVNSSEKTEPIKASKTESPVNTTTVSNDDAPFGALNLPAITILKKDTSLVFKEDAQQQQHEQPQVDLNNLPIKEALTIEAPVISIKEEEQSDSDGDDEAPLQIDLKREENEDMESSSSMHEDEQHELPVGAKDAMDDVTKQKESHLKHLGLLTHQAATEEKLRLMEQKQKTPPPPTFGNGTGGAGHPSGSPGGILDEGDSNGSAIASSSSGTTSKSSPVGIRAGNSHSGGKNGNKSTRSSKDESRVPLKTVIKLNRGEKRKQRLPLKMTFQKGKSKGGTDRDSNGSGGHDETTFYTIQNEVDHQNQSQAEQQQQQVRENSNAASSAAGSNSSGSGSVASSTSTTPTITATPTMAGGRKTHNRSHTTSSVLDGATATDVGAGETTGKEGVEPLLIPEKASSFKVHPGQLCQDQCIYCGGKFGLYDTPCHIAAIKSVERQQKILNNETKLTLESCLCDACYRHVDRRANYPSYKKKPSSSSTQSVTPLVIKLQNPSAGDKSKENQHYHSDEDVNNKGRKKSSTDTEQRQSQQQQQVQVQKQQLQQYQQIQLADVAANNMPSGCQVKNCESTALHTLRRKWLLKMRKTITNLLDINLDHPAVAFNLVPICDSHYELISHLLVCAMCRRRLPKNHIYYIVSEIPQLERLIQEQGIAMRLSNSALVVCKLCRYYANLLLKPPDAKSQKAQFIKNYNRRLLQFYDRENEQEVQTHEPASGRTDIVISDGEDDDEEPLEDDVLKIGDRSVSVQRRVNSRKSPDVTIVENNCSQMSDLEEITITPTVKSREQQMENDHHILEQLAAVERQRQQQRRDDNADMTKVLKSNPNISMRELFPGEEELGIHVNIPFSGVTTRTPEGWSKVTTTIQYDDNTRMLWEELQKPYGNQSSFLRHMILLERFFRNGDLVLSKKAKNNAITYSEAWQNRLRSYDNVPTPTTAMAAPQPAKDTLLLDDPGIIQQLSNAPITIVPAVTKHQKSANAKSEVGPVSLLKSNNLHLNTMDNANTLKRKLSLDGANICKTTNRPIDGQRSSGTEGAVAKLMKLEDTIPGGIRSVSSMPPELISINTRQNVTITTIPARSQPPPQAQQQTSLLQPGVGASATAQPTRRSVADIIKLPVQLTEEERRETGARPWRPTLIPIAPNSSEAIKTGPLYQTADGRHLPKMVQVMSGGKPYHISIHDYNRMCILRREKLVMMAKKQNLTAPGGATVTAAPIATTMTDTANTSHITNAAASSSGVARTLVNSNKQPIADVLSSTARLVQIPNQILEQNSLIPISNSNGGGGGGTAGNRAKLINSNSNGSLTNAYQSNSKPNTTSTNVSNIKPVTTASWVTLPNTTSVIPVTAASSITVSSNTTVPMPPLTSATQIEQLIKHNKHLLTNLPAQSSSLTAFIAAATNQQHANAAATQQLYQRISNSTVNAAGTTNAVATSVTLQGMDNAAAQLLSKIPKSLTVIPQQKQRSMSRVSSHEDQNSA